MAFLTPLYLLAGMAVTLPILFHLIRQTPKGRQVFSSLMFLEPSPPKVTKRSRIEDWLLLFLRALAVCLLALAFSRPFLRTQSQFAASEEPGRHIVILIDTSASMQREKLWDSAQELVKQTLQDLDPGDAVAILSFDEEVSSILSFHEWAQLDSLSRKSVVSNQLDALSPTFAGTELGSAMMEANDLLTDALSEQSHERKLIVISDFQAGSHWEKLNGYEWSEDVVVQLLPVEVAQSTNASLQPIAGQSTSDNKIRLRVNNNSESQQEEFEIRWLDEFTTPEQVEKPSANATTVYVPPGQSRVVQAPELPADVVPQRLVLSGDQQDFDNTCFITERDPWNVNILFIGQEDSDGPEGLRFFLAPVFPETAIRQLTITDWQAKELQPPVEASIITLAIIGGRLTESQAGWCKAWLDQGGQALFVARSAEQAEAVYALSGLEGATVNEADVVDYEMLRSVDLTHPVFAPFDDPRFADFSKLRFWNHRIFEKDSFPNSKTLAIFEGGAPAIFELPVGQGRLVVFASGWNRSDSDLAVWSKFVPMMNGFLEYLGDQKDFQPSYFVGDRLLFEGFKFGESDVFIRSPDGEIANYETADQVRLEQIGIYSIAGSKDDFTNTKPIRFAVNLPPTESKTDPVSIDLLVAAGVPVKTASATEMRSGTTLESERQLMNRELESQQKLWKWILMAAIVVLFWETILAGIRQRRTSADISVA